MRTRALLLARLLEQHSATLSSTDRSEEARRTWIRAFCLYDELERRAAPLPDEHAEAMAWLAGQLDDRYRRDVRSITAASANRLRLIVAGFVPTLDTTMSLAKKRSSRTSRATRKTSALAGVLVMMPVGCATTTTERLGLPELQTVPNVELSRYVGTWFEIASFPHRFQEGCTGTTATYTLRADGEIAVLNRCHKHSLHGDVDSAEGRARVVDSKTNAKLEVTFFWPFWGDYWIIDLGPEYEYAVVGHPGRDYLWILSRTPTLEPATYEEILSRLRAQHYAVDRLQKTLQPSTGLSSGDAHY